ncbi:MAG: hypothetical protein ACE5F3_02960 [Mariprofundaceae bacterium]
MLNKRALRRMGFGFIAVFTVQLLVASFCAVPASAHVAMVSHQSASLQGMQGICSKNMPVQMSADQMAMQHQVCAHCDMPDLAYGNVAVAADAKVLAHATLLTIPVSQTPEHADMLRMRILAPPRSSTLLFTNTQRILI